MIVLDQDGNVEERHIDLNEPHQYQTFFQSIGAHVHSTDKPYNTPEGRLQELAAYERSKSFWILYRSICQIRFGYFSFLVMMVIVIFSFSYLMEFFFAIFLPSAKFDEYYHERAAFILFLLPFTLFILSYLFEESSRLFMDAIDKHDGSFPNFRLSVAVVIHYLRHYKQLSSRTRRFRSNSPPVSTDSEATEDNIPLLLSEDTDPYRDNCDGYKQDDEDNEVIVPPNSNNEQVQDGEFIVHNEVARKRWKRAISLVSSVNMFTKVQDVGPPIDLSTFVIVDMICPLLFEVLTIISFVMNFTKTWSVTEAFHAYVATAFWVCATYLILWMITHFWTSRSPKMRIVVSNYRRKRRNIRRHIRELYQDQQSDELWLMALGFRFFYHLPNLLDISHKRRNKKKNAVNSNERHYVLDESSQYLSNSNASQIGQLNNTLSSRVKATITQRPSKSWYQTMPFYKKCTLLFIAVVLSGYISLIYFPVGWCLLTISMILLCSAIQKRFPQIFGQAFHKFIMAFAILSSIFFSLAIGLGRFSRPEFRLGPIDPSMANVTTSDVSFAAQVFPETLTLHSAVFPSHVNPYAVCGLNYKGLSILDLALLSDAVYGLDTEAQKRTLTNYFAGTSVSDWKYVARNNETTDHQAWMEIYFPSINTTVVAVRGTASATDGLEDLHFWFGIMIMQAVDVFVPFLQQLPHEFIVWFLTMKELVPIMPAPIFAPVVEHVLSLKKRVGDRLVITGHSLGGSIAAVLGAKSQTNAISFSGPGLLFSRGRFNVEKQAIKDNVLTVKPAKDIVPKIDVLGGVVQEIRCEHSTPLACHGIVTHMCELFTSCGDIRGRNWETNQQCQAYRELQNRNRAQLI